MLDQLADHVADLVKNDVEFSVDRLPLVRAESPIGHVAADEGRHEAAGLRRQRLGFGDNSHRGRLFQTFLFQRTLGPQRDRVIGRHADRDSARIGQKSGEGEAENRLLRVQRLRPVLAAGRRQRPSNDTCRTWKLGNGSFQQANRIIRLTETEMQDGLP